MNNLQTDEQNEIALGNVVSSARPWDLQGPDGSTYYLSKQRKSLRQLGSPNLQ